MKLQTKTRKIRRFGETLGENATIAATPEMFEILSGTVYTDQITAIIRELSVNAADAHFENGNENKPFDIHLPNTLEPEFVIRDYGPGLSRDNVLKLYQTYGKSTKTHNNDQTGCLGIGSKSPYSYAESFEVISRYGGKKMTFSCYKNEHGVPRSDLMGEQETDEPTGLEIRIAVPANDIAEWQKKASAVFTHFNVLPNVTGYDQFNVETVDYILTGNGWGIRRNKYHNTWSTSYYHNGALAIMGQIAYPIPASFAETPEQAVLLNQGVDIQFDLGTLWFNAGREKLKQNKECEKSVRKRLNEVLKDAAAMIAKEIEDADCLWDAKVLYNNLFSFDGQYRMLRNIIKEDDVVFQGKKVKGGSIDIGTKDIQVRQFRRRQNTRYMAKNQWIASQSESSLINPTDETTLIIDDLGRGGFSRCSYAVRKGDYTHIVFLKFENATALKKFEDTTGLDTSKLMKSSELPKKPPRRIGRNGQPVDKTVCTLNPGGCRQKDSWSACGGIDLTKSRGVYVRLKGYKAVLKDGSEVTAQWVQRKFRLVSNTSPGKNLLNNMVIFGIKKSRLKDIEDSPHWIQFEDWIEKFGQRVAKERDLSHDAELARAYTDCNSNCLAFIENFMLRLSADLPQGHELYDIKEYVDKCEQAAQDKQKHNIIVNALRALDIPFDEDKDDAGTYKDIESWFNQVIERDMPMLMCWKESSGFFTSRTSWKLIKDSHWPYVKNYVKSLDI